MNKIYMNIALLAAASFLSACSVAPVPAPIETENRTIASKEYECQFEEDINGQMTSFVFSPESLKLSITNDKLGSQTILLEEDSFISGGVTYISSPGNAKSNWTVKKIEFMSFVSKPSVTLSLKKTNKDKPVLVSKKCRS
jgi:hypothetical protein